VALLPDWNVDDLSGQIGQNLWVKAGDLVVDIFPESVHIRLLGRGGAADTVVWDLARQHQCLLVSKDEEFHRLALLRGAPPKFVWIRLGNCSTHDIAQLLRRRREDIVTFNDQDEATVLELG
jgi:predicted nuclease of predicted toxin-antitoxin system